MPGRDLFPRLEYVSAVHRRFLKIYERAWPLRGERTKTGSNSIVDLTLPSSFFRLVLGNNERTGGGGEGREGVNWYREF